MNDHLNESEDFNRRDFLKGGSFAAVMAMLGGVPLLAQTNETPVVGARVAPPKVKVALIGLGPWGREILNTLGRLPQADIAAICDTYPASLKRSADAAPGAKQVSDYQAILADKDIKAVIVATGTPHHKDVTLAALKAGKHVYCEAPLAHTIEDAREIAKAAKEAKQLIFQAGLQLRSDPQRKFLLPFIRSGALGKTVMARSQWHKKTSWRFTSPNPEREKAINWRLSKATSPGLLGEIGIHQIDQAIWFLNGPPRSAYAVGNIAFWNDGRDVPDTVQALIEFSGEVRLSYDCTLASSFDSDYELYFGSDATVMLRESKAWMFKEVDSPLLGWEVYASKETFYKETGIALVAGRSKGQSSGDAAADALTSTPLYYALQNFLHNASDLEAAIEDYVSAYGADDQEGLLAQLAKVTRRPAAGYLEGYQATVAALKANEAALRRERVEMKPELYEL
jgi:predicted dehydrogenase